MMIWAIDPFHSLVEFSVQHLMISIVKGRFTDIHGSINLDLQHIESSWVKAQIKTASIHTGVPQRDAHLRSADFFEAARYPIITFESTRVRPVGQNRCIVDGNLSLHGVTKSLPLHVIYTGRNQDPMTNAWRIGLYATAQIDRRDFGMTFNQSKAGVDLVGYEVRIDITVEAMQVG